MSKGIWSFLKAFLALSFLILLLKNPHVGWEGIQQIVIVMKGITQSFAQHVPQHVQHLQHTTTTGQ